MRVVLFYHSLVSDWNHGNAHFLRGVASELISRGHEVAINEPSDSWSRNNLIADHGKVAIEDFESFYPNLMSKQYDFASLDLDRALDRADLVMVHEWNTPELVAAVGKHRARARSYKLLFHDTHHRMVTNPDDMSRYDLRDYDGVLAFGNVIREMYLAKELTANAWTWHEAADTRVFKPHHPEGERKGDVVWVGNWGDEERTEELQEFLIRPVHDLGLRAVVHGVRYPKTGRRLLREAGIAYKGWIPNYRVPEVFAGFDVTVHVPRRPYVKALPGIPTIRVFEALACGIPLISAPWEDAENLFRPGEDYLVARNGREMREHIKHLRGDRDLARWIAARGRSTILERHACAHRVDELMEIIQKPLKGEVCR